MTNRRYTVAVKDFIDEQLTQEQWSAEQIAGHCNNHKISMFSVGWIYQDILQDKKDGTNNTSN